MSIQIKKKFILNDAVDGEKLLLLNNQTMRGRNAADSANIDLMKLDPSNKLQFLVVPQVSSDPVANEDLARKGYIDTEVTNLQNQIDALDTGLQDELDDTQVGAGLQADGSYVAPVGSNYLGAAVSLKDADSKLDTQIKTVADNLASEITDRIADVDAEESRALAAEGLLDGRLDILEGADTVEGSVAKAEKDAKDYTDVRETAITAAYQAYTDQAELDAISSANSYTDTEIAALVDSAPAVLDTLNELAAALGDDPNFATTVAGQIGNIQSELDSTQTGAGLGTDGSYTAPAGSNYLGAAVSLKDADNKLDAQIKVVADGLAQEILDRVADVNAEETRALAAESALDGRLDIIEGADTVEGSVAKAEKDAKDYADGLIAQEVIDRNSAISTAVSNLVDGAPALLDTLNELAAAINDDENFAATIAGQISGLDTRVDALEIASVEFKPTEQFIYNGSDTITLSYLAIANSLRVSVDRLAVHQGYDYTVGVSGGFTTITFIGSLVTPGQEKLANGDEIYVEGAKKAIV